MTEDELQVPDELVADVRANQRRHAGQARGVRQEPLVVFQSQRPAHDAEAELPVEDARAHDRRHAEGPGLRRLAEPEPFGLGDLDPRATVLLDLDGNVEVVRQQVSQTVGVLRLKREPSGVVALGAVRGGVSVLESGRPDAEQAPHVVAKAVGLGPVEAGRRLGLGPGPVEE